MQDIQLPLSLREIILKAKRKVNLNDQKIPPNRVLSHATFSLLVLALGFLKISARKKKAPEIKILGDLFRVKTVKNGSYTIL